MGSLSFASITNQVAGHLRGELLRGRWRGVMPGRNQLAEALGVSRKTVQGALAILEDSGLLVGQGAGRPRRIVASPKRSSAGLRIALIELSPLGRADGNMIELQHKLRDAGHHLFFAEQTLSELKMSVRRIANLAKQTEADAWIVGSGSREVLQWFSRQGKPAFARYGRTEGVRVATARPDKVPAMAAATRRLTELGHRRISFLCRGQIRLPEPGRTARAFLAALEAAGIQCSGFNLPDWDESKEGFGKLLEALFMVTPPTALIVDESYLYHAIHHFLSKKGLRVPDDVSLICTDWDEGFVWCQPSVAHIHWSDRPVLGRIVQWADAVSSGRTDVRQVFTRAEYVDGGTVGPARQNKIQDLRKDF